MIKLVVYLVTIVTLISSQAFGQSDTNVNKIYIGGAFGLSKYTVVQSNVPTSPFSNNNAEVGAVGIIDFKNKVLFKTGLFYSYFRSPFINDVSTYDEFLQLPVLFSFLRHKPQSSQQLDLLIGPQLSILTRQGLAEQGQDYYHIDNSLFGGFYKVGLVFELSFNNYNNKMLNSLGLKFQLDIPALTIKQNNGHVINDNFISGGIYYNLNKKVSR